jgi:hypothetical protein
MFNIWRQLRLAGSVLAIVGLLIHRIDMVVYSFMVVMIGAVNGLTSLEDRVTKLEPKEKTDEEA